jgi:hypothetical protein
MGQPSHGGQIPVRSAVVVLALYYRPTMTAGAIHVRDSANGHTSLEILSRRTTHLTHQRLDARLHLNLALTPALALFVLGRRQRSCPEIDRLTLCRRARPTPCRSDHPVRAAQPHAHKRILFGPWVFHVDSNSMGTEMDADRKERGKSSASELLSRSHRRDLATAVPNGQRCSAN